MLVGSTDLSSMFHGRFTSFAKSCPCFGVGAVGMGKYMLVLWVPVMSSSSVVWNGAQQWLEPMACPPFAAGFLARFRLLMVGAECATVPGLVAGDVPGTYPASGAENHPPSPGCSILRPSL